MRILAIIVSVLAAVAGGLLLRLPWVPQADFDVLGVAWLFFNLPKLILYGLFLFLLGMAAYCWIRVAFGLLVLLAFYGAAAATAEEACAEFERLATPAEIARPLRPDEEAEILAIEATGAFVAPGRVYSRIMRDLAAIRDSFAEVDGIAVFRTWHPQELILGFDLRGMRALDTGAYTAWNCMNRFYRLREMDKETLHKLNGVVLRFEGRYNTPMLAAAYAKLPDVRYAEAQGFVGDGSDVCVEIRGDANHYLFDAASGDCPAGCTVHRYWGFSSDAAGRVRALGTWIPDPARPPPQWFARLEKCRSWL